MSTDLFSIENFDGIMKVNVRSIFDVIYIVTEFDTLFLINNITNGRFLLLLISLESNKKKGSVMLPYFYFFISG